jgi:hypothetical protein
MTTRPLIPTVIHTEFGDVLDNDEFKADSAHGRDLLFVKGYSDRRIDRDLALKEVREGKRNAKDVPTLPVRLHWVRHERRDHSPDSTKPVEFGGNRYRNVTKADIGQDWITEMPIGAQVGPGDTIRLGDTTLMVSTAKDAARASALLQRETEARLRDTAAAPLFRAGQSKPGTDPTFETTVGPEVKRDDIVGTHVKKH